MGADTEHIPVGFTEELAFGYNTLLHLLVLTPPPHLPNHIRNSCKLLKREKLEEKTIKTKHVPVKKNYIFCQGRARGTGSKVLPIIFYYRAKVLIKRNKKSSHFDLFPELDMV